jgi:hypothetical protein
MKNDQIQTSEKLMQNMINQAAEAFQVLVTRPLHHQLIHIFHYDMFRAGRPDPNCTSV